MRRAEYLRLERLLEWDRACTLHLNRAATSREWITVLAVVSRLSDGTIWYFLMGALALMGPVGLKCAQHMFLAGASAVVLYKLVKHYACRPRPCTLLEDVHSCVPPLDEFSFPSGHTLHAVTFTTVAIAYFPTLAIALVPFTCCVGVSRVALGLHYPSDVIAGAAIGGVVGVLSFYFV